MLPESDFAAMVAAAPGMARFSAVETLPDVRYVDGFVGVSGDVPFTKVRAGRGPWSRSPMGRISAMCSLELMKQGGALSLEEKTKANVWADTRPRGQSVSIF